jgi:hypothetical protein
VPDKEGTLLGYWGFFRNILLPLVSSISPIISANNLLGEISLKQYFFRHPAFLFAMKTARGTGDMIADYSVTGTQRSETETWVGGAEYSDCRYSKATADASSPNHWQRQYRNLISLQLKYQEVFRGKRLFWAIRYRDWARNRR